jgi:glycosyltransferase involved in cell wall biosynthesis
MIGGALIGGGGTERHLLEFLRRIDRRRFTPLMVFIRAGEQLRREFEAVGVPVLDLALERSYTPSGMMRLVRGARELRKRGVSVLHAYSFHANLYGSVIALMAGIPHLLVSERGRAYAEWHRRLARRFYYHRADRVLVNCESLRDFVRECEHREEKIQTIPNGVDLDLVRPTGARAHVRSELGIPPSANLIGCVGRMRTVKGQRYLIEAFSSLASAFPEARLLLVGGGPDEPEHRQAVVRAGLEGRVHFVGYQDDVRPYLEAMDIFVLPSLSEAHSMALLEAMAMGKAVVATAVGGNRETVRPGVSGLLVAAGSSHGIGDALVRLLTEPELAARLGCEAERAATRFDVREMVRSYESLYLSLAEASA